ncbi:MAG: SMP-30/gluconolactonase/LRE family protein, partial [Gemmatimonadota bacterium]|nr:SMP-30/gluconolactonase/LRE family protein [Gemmatimonadota bacterium]
MRFCAIFLLLVMLPARVFCSAVETIEPEFSSVVPEDAALYQVAGGLQFTEGPVWVEGKDGQGQGYLLFSDIPADRIYRWDDPDKLSVWRTPSGKSNGLLLDSRGRVLACEHWNRRVSLYLAPDSVVALCTSYSGGALNSPNDIAIGPEGALWFTDPPYGLEGRKKEQAGNFVFRLSPGETEPEVMVS